MRGIVKRNIGPLHWIRKLNGWTWWEGRAIHQQLSNFTLPTARPWWWNMISIRTLSLHILLSICHTRPKRSIPVYHHWRTVASKNLSASHLDAAHTASKSMAMVMVMRRASWFQSWGLPREVQNMAVDLLSSFAGIQTPFSTYSRTPGQCCDHWGFMCLQQEDSLVDLKLLRNRDHSTTISTLSLCLTDIAEKGQTSEMGDSHPYFYPIDPSL